ADDKSRVCIKRFNFGTAACLQLAGSSRVVDSHQLPVMYTLLSGTYKYLTRREEYYVMIIGLDNAGKTTLLERIKALFLGVPALPPEKIAPTVGLNRVKPQDTDVSDVSLVVCKVDIKSARLNFWDLGGQRDLHSIWENYYSECHAIVFVVDSTDKARIEECKETFEKIIQNDDAEGLPILMLANKQDVEGALRVEEIKEVFNQIALKLGARDSRVLPISALEGHGVQDAIDWLFLRLQRNKMNRPPVFQS
ncbi:hypothetical protein INT43_007204, partial [Umbelopsis isabellina]